MSEYCVIKREKCPNCDGAGCLDMSWIGGMGAPLNGCRKGHIETRVDADEWLLGRLARVRFNEFDLSNLEATTKMVLPRFETEMTTTAK